MTDHSERVRASLAGRYTIERELGAGGMATVYLARDLKHDRVVALKVLRPDLAAVLGAERFLLEIRISAKLDHPHILTLIDSGTDDGFVWYVLPLVRGESLRGKLAREKQLRLEEALTITKQIASRSATPTATGSSTGTLNRRTFCCMKARRCSRTSGSPWPSRKQGATA